MKAALHSHLLESLRRERPTSTLGGTPVVTRDRVIDYASAGLKIDVAVHHLDEALCGKQKLRAEAALQALRDGVQELEEWMTAAGYVC